VDFDYYSAIFQTIHGMGNILADCFIDIFLSLLTVFICISLLFDQKKTHNLYLS